MTPGDVREHGCGPSATRIAFAIGANADRSFAMARSSATTRAPSEHAARGRSEPLSARRQGDDVTVGGGGPVDADGQRIAGRGDGGTGHDGGGAERRGARRHLFQEHLR